MKHPHTLRSTDPVPLGQAFQSKAGLRRRRKTLRAATFERVDMTCDLVCESPSNCPVALYPLVFDFPEFFKKQGYCSSGRCLTKRLERKHADLRTMDVILQTAHQSLCPRILQYWADKDLSLFPEEGFGTEVREFCTAKFWRPLVLGRHVVLIYDNQLD